MDNNSAGQSGGAFHLTGSCAASSIQPTLIGCSHAVACTGEGVSITIATDSSVSGNKVQQASSMGMGMEPSEPAVYATTGGCTAV